MSMLGQTCVISKDNCTFLTFTSLHSTIVHTQTPLCSWIYSCTTFSLNLSGSNLKKWSGSCFTPAKAAWLDITSLFSSQRPITFTNTLSFVSFLNASLEDYTGRKKGGVSKRAAFYLKEIHQWADLNLEFCKRQEKYPSSPPNSHCLRLHYGSMLYKWDFFSSDKHAAVRAVTIL